MPEFAYSGTRGSTGGTWTVADYSIFILGESQLSFPDGGELDGVSSGDGRHLLGRTIILNSNNWQEVFISDGGTDSSFGDNDGNQVLNGAQTIDGTPYGSGTRVESEYGLTLSDGVNTWDVIGFNVRDSSPSFGTIEALAFIGGPGGFPPIDTPLTVTAAREGPNDPASDFATPICFAEGSLIETPAGLVPIERLSVGDYVICHSGQSSRILWRGQRETMAIGRSAAVEIECAEPDPCPPLRVSQQHRLLVASPQAELLFGSAEVFVPAIALVDTGRARLYSRTLMTYHHILLER
ncbi:MAG: Hint domain-containing protein, partial [Tateyamaria sp.]